MTKDKDMGLGIVYDEKGFEKSAKRMKKKVEKTGKKLQKDITKIELEFDVDDKGLKKQVKISQKTLDNLRAHNIDIDATIQPFLRGINQVESAGQSLEDVEVQVDADISQAIGNIGQVESEAGAIPDADIQITADNSNAIGNINQVRSEVASLDTSINININADGSDAISATKKVKSALKGVKDKTVEVSGNASEVGTAVVGGGLAVGGAAIASIDDLHGAQNHLRANTGLIHEDLDDLMDTVKNLGSEGMGSFGEIAHATSTVKKGFKDLKGKELEQAVRTAMNMAELMEVDVAEATWTATQMSKNLGLTHHESMGMIIKGTQEGLNASGDLLGTLTEFSPQLASMGYDADQFYNIIKSGSKHGIFNTALIGDAMKEFEILTSATLTDDQIDMMDMMGMDSAKFAKDMRKGGEVAFKARKELMDKISKVNNSDKKNDIGVAFFGSMWEDTSGKILPAIKEGIEMDSSSNADDRSYAVEDVNQKDDSFGKMATGLWNDTKTELEPLGKELIKLAKDVLPPVIKGIGDMMKAFNSMPDGVKEGIIKGIVALTLVVPAIVMVLGFIANIITVMGVLIPVFKAIGVTIAAIAGGISLPFVLIAAAVIALIALIVWKWDWFKAFFIASGQAIGAFFVSMWGMAKAVFTGFIDGVVAGALWLKDMVVSYFTTMLNFWKSVGTGLIAGGKAAVEGIANGFVWLFEKGVAFWSALFNGFKNLFMMLVGAGLTFWQTIGGFFVNLKDKAVGAVTGLKDRAVGIFGALKDSVTNRFNAIKSAIIDPIKSAIDTVLGHVERLKSMFSNLKLKIPSIGLPKLPGIKSSSSGKDGEKGDSWTSKLNWFANGGIVTKPGLVGVGEAGEEAIVPLTNQKKLRPMTKQISKDVLKMTGGNFGKSSGTPEAIVNKNYFSVQLDSQELSGVMVKPVMNKMREDETNSSTLAGTY